jgi:hypothetical protein
MARTARYLRKRSSKSVRAAWIAALAISLAGHPFPSKKIRVSGRKIWAYPTCEAALAVVCVTVNADVNHARPSPGCPISKLANVTTSLTATSVWMVAST